jgi:very-short-patch-repair endonuclease
VTRASAGAYRVAASLASQRHGVVSRIELLAAGITLGWIRRRLEDGQLQWLHRGVYVLGPVISREARALAATMACGPRAVVGRWTAAAEWRILPWPSEGYAPEVVVSGTRPQRPGIRVVRVSSIREDEVTRLGALPITTPARTLHDLAMVASDRDLERAYSETLALHLATTAAISEVVARYPGHRGSRRLRALLTPGRSLVTRSKAERLFRRLVRRAELGEPASNVEVAGAEVDFHWPESGLVVEIDGFAYHSSRPRFESDRRRDARLTAAGLRVMRVTWREMVDRPEAVIARLAASLARSPMTHL